MSADNLPEYTPPAPPEGPPDEDRVKIRCGVFFDGTLNNRVNIEQRLKAMPTGELTAEELAYLSQTELTDKERAQAKALYDQYKANDPDDDNSYEAYFSNIVKLERHLDAEVTEPEGAEYQHRLKVYVEGSGSIDRAKDDQAGFAFAKGIAGIEQKVDLGLTRALKEIKKAYNKAYEDKSTPIDLITLDVFGFSRGAACARYFIHRALFDYNGSQYRAYQEALRAGHDVSLAEVQVAIQSQQAIKNALVNDGYTVGEVKICFAGLFDTVSSFGYLLVLNSNNTEDLKLNAVDRAEETVHLTAADEHRQYFSLTDIASAGGKGREVYLPGVHSDIGGGYRETGTEKRLVYQGPQAEAEADRQRLIAAGWYTQDEIELMRIQLKDIKLEDVALKEPALKALGYTRFKNAVQYAQTHGTRPNLSNHYSRIPLHLMAGYARKKKLMFKGRLEKEEKIPEALDDAQKELNAYVAQHDALGARTSKPEHWHDNTRAWLRELRHRYFHFSAQVKKGHTPRLESGQRIRQVHRG